KIDGYRKTDIGITDDGRIRTGDRIFNGPLAVQIDGSRAVFTGAEKVATGNTFELWKPAPTLRFAMLAGGWYNDGWLAWQSFVSIWPDASGRVQGTLRLEVGLPLGTTVTPLKLKAPGYKRTFVLRPGTRRTIEVPVSWRGPWTVHLSSPHARYIGLRSVSVRALSPVFTQTGGTVVTCAVPSGTKV